MKKFDIVYEGKVSADNPNGVNVSYDTLLIRGGTHIFLNVEVWDFDQYNHDDYIRTYSFDLNINNGWGVDMNIPYKFSTKKKVGDTVSYKEICHSDGKIMLDMSGENRRVVFLEGGKGGLGNQHYATSTMQAPKYAKPGQPAKELTASTKNQLSKINSIAFLNSFCVFALLSGFQ